MQLSRKALNARWAWTTAAALAAMAVLNLADALLRARTGYGAYDLQGLTTGWGVRLVLDHWTSPPDAALAGFGLGFDYLFMPLYGAALYFGAVVACERYAPKPGALQRILSLLAAAPLAGALCDACENAVQIYMFVRGPSDALAMIAAEATTAKWAGVLIGLVMTLMALTGMLLQRKKKGEAPTAGTTN